MVTVMGPSVAKCLAMPGGGRCHLALPLLHPLLPAHGHLYLSLPLFHPLAPTPRDASVSVYSPVCPGPSVPVRLPPVPTRVPIVPALCSQACSIMKSWIQATFLYFLARHLWVLPLLLNG